MAEYIERKAAIEVFKRADAFGLCRETIQEKLKKVPAADVAPVRHARWESFGLASLKCSDCGYVDYEKMYHRYCPNCGAKMDLEESNG